MTNEKAIKYLKQLYPNGGHCWLDEQRIEAIGMAVKALQEEPVSEDLEEAANNAVIALVPSFGQKYSDGSYVSSCRDSFKREELIELFKAGAKWQKQQILDCNTTLQRTFELGKQEMKQQMMKEAVDGKIYETQARSKMKACTTGYISHFDYRVGEKVKVLIIKED